MLRVLLIDDEPRVARALEFAVSRRDVELTTIPSPDEIVKHVRAAAPDVILLDLALGGDDGLAVCRQLKSDNQLAAIPILILSGQTDAATKAASFAAGADDFVSKPFVPTELLARIDARVRRGMVP
jgi:DNA-binding response OmpR family regulator